MLGQFESGEDFSALRRLVGLTQVQFAQAMGSAFTRCATGSRDDGATMVRRSRCCALRRAIRGSFARTSSRQLDARDDRVVAAAPAKASRLNFHDLVALQIDVPQRASALPP